METLVAVAHHRNHYHGSVKTQGPARFRSLTSRNFKGLNCQTFQSKAGLISTPQGDQSTTVSKQAAFFSSPSSTITFSAASSSSSRRTPCPSSSSHSICKATPKPGDRSPSIPITGYMFKNEKSSNEEFSIENRSFSYSELWAGPAYSNSPPPSSLPIPKFSLHQKRSVSLDLLASKPMIDMQPVAKSAPTSPTKEHIPSARDLFLMEDSATKTLCRILNLENADE